MLIFSLLLQRKQQKTLEKTDKDQDVTVAYSTEDKVGLFEGDTIKVHNFKLFQGFVPDIYSQIIISADDWERSCHKQERCKRRGKFDIILRKIRLRCYETEIYQSIHEGRFNVNPSLKVMIFIVVIGPQGT